MTARTDLVYEETLQLAEGVDYGIPLSAQLSGTANTPPQGVQLDQEFRGTLTGSRLRGTIEGTDYLHIRADGAMFVHSHARIDTDDRERIAFFADGTARIIPDSRPESCERT